MSGSRMGGWVVCTLLLACGGLTRECVYHPVAPVDSGGFFARDESPIPW